MPGDRPPTPTLSHPAVRELARAAPALRAVLAELAARGQPSAGVIVTRLHLTLAWPGGPAVRCCGGWLLWPTGRTSTHGRPLHTLHPVTDPAGAARRLTYASLPCEESHA